MVDAITQKLEGDESINKDFFPSRGAIKFLCSHNGVRRLGNDQAHKATEDEIKAAIELANKLDPEDGDHLIELFQVVYHTRYGGIGE